MILNNKTNVSFSDSTRQKVLDAAKELGYQKKKKSIEQTSKPLSKIILIMCPFLSNHYYTTLVHSITERAHDYGYLPLLHQHCETRAPNNIIWIL
jgi:LacI family transcriptional regulator